MSIQLDNSDFHNEIDVLEAPISKCPFHFKSSSVKSSPKTNYGSYLKVPELLQLQQPLSSPQQHDELLFIIIHQTYELWFKQIIHEIDKTIEEMKNGKPLRGHYFMNRVIRIFKLLLDQIHIIESMSPVDFLKFRDALYPASGFQSLQFREIEIKAGIRDDKIFQQLLDYESNIDALRIKQDQIDLPTAYFQMLIKLGFKVPKNSAEMQRQGDCQPIIDVILPIYQNPYEHLDVYYISETLVEFDELLSLWREHHIRMAERIIGTRQGTGGSSGVAYLRETTTKRGFSALWAVRGYLSVSGE